MKPKPDMEPKRPTDMPRKQGQFGEKKCPRCFFFLRVFCFFLVFFFSFVLDHFFGVSFFGFELLLGALTGVFADLDVFFCFWRFFWSFLPRFSFLVS